MGVIYTIMKEERSKIMDTYYKVVNAYSPVFSSFSGGVYEMELTRAAIHTFATHASKASPIIKGDKYKRLENTLKNRPNEMMTASQFLYKLASIYEAENNAFIIPVYEDRSAGKIVGLYPVRGKDCQITKVGSKLMLKYKVYANTGGCFNSCYTLCRSWAHEKSFLSQRILWRKQSTIIEYDEPNEYATTSHHQFS